MVCEETSLIKDFGSATQCRATECVQTKADGCSGKTVQIRAFIACIEVFPTH